MWPRMEDASPIALFPARVGRRPMPVCFDRQELSEILDVYGRMVAAGQWRDYAIDGTAEAAVFSVFRRASEMPLYRIVKWPRLARRQGAYGVVGMDGRILKRGHTLAAALKMFDRKLIRLVE